MKYYYKTTLAHTTFGEAIEKVTLALKAEDFATNKG